MNWSRVGDKYPSCELELSPSSCLRAVAGGPDRYPPRSEVAIEASIAFWQATHPPVITRAGHCLECQEPLVQERRSWLPMIVAPRQVAGLHFACHLPWQRRRRNDAALALALAHPSPVRP